MNDEFCIQQRPESTERKMMKNDFDPSNGMTVQEFETVKKLIEDGNL